jgi:hypothetical protein
LRMTTSVLVPGCESTCVSTLTSGTIAAPSSVAAPSATAVTGTEGSAPLVIVSMATASGITDPSACAKKSTQSQFHRLRLLRTMTTGHKVHISSTKMASSRVAFTVASVCGDGVGSHSSVERLLMVKFRQPSHKFTFSVDMNFISYPLVLTPLV